MAIYHMSYVACDNCGDPAECADSAAEARAAARRVGFVRVGRQDLCTRCKPPKPRGEITNVGSTLHTQETSSSSGALRR